MSIRCPVPRSKMVIYGRMTGFDIGKKFPLEQILVDLGKADLQLKLVLTTSAIVEPVAFIYKRSPHPQ